MTLSEWGIVFIVIHIIHFLGTNNLYQKAGFKKIDALIPFYNVYILTKILDRPWWYGFFLYVPVLNLIMFMVVWIELAFCFGKRSTKDMLLSVFTLGFYLFIINYDKNSSYQGAFRFKKETFLGSLAFAAIAAGFVRMFFLEPYLIPTGSLEQTLLSGDFLIANKMSYGIRPPMTPLSLPLLHDVVPGTTKRVYISKPQIPYYRLLQFKRPSVNDIVIFNYPADTTAGKDPMGNNIWIPVDKRQNYVKRCVGAAGDTISIVDGQIYINSKKQEYPKSARIQHMHFVKFDNSSPISYTNLVNNGILTKYEVEVIQSLGDNEFIFNLPDNRLAELKTNSRIEACYQINFIKNKMVYFTNDSTKINQELNASGSLIGISKEEAQIGVSGILGGKNWNNNFYGPLVIPTEGMTIELTEDNIPVYQHAIVNLDGREGMTYENGQIKQDGKTLNSYTFLQDYYWMMGDNRDNSIDSRYFGFVPENHIVGKPFMVWLSAWKEQSGFRVRWERFFTFVDDTKEKRTSYLWVVILLTVAYIGYKQYKKRKKA